ncbi:DUF6660 family protein [Flavobacterium capsici]|uniref:DUF6660 family protein n=1 Tax=Flavobacterium capsici TaxID=3075618 RepID=A0AA96F0K2_9FLAO|nr:MULTISPECIES: DUF6660 family protein [unclassified Flavobacterium]WNM20417.1 DUF6660 family protein [Flavobacterium sp. PMR2A8]WNM23123.1 DUF6660 family protein [Flavobacterium sp. PMTSA4]
MKLLTVILSIYIFTLSAVPCVDVEIGSAAHSTVIHSSENKANSHDKENDLCSPFCICNCCSGITLSYVPTITYNFQNPFEVIKTPNSFYTSALHSNFFGSIWQPPQIV